MGIHRDRAAAGLGISRVARWGQDGGRMAAELQQGRGEELMEWGGGSTAAG